MDIKSVSSSAYKVSTVVLNSKPTGSINTYRSTLTTMGSNENLENGEMSLTAVFDLEDYVGFDTEAYTILLDSDVCLQSTRLLDPTYSTSEVVVDTGAVSVSSFTNSSLTLKIDLLDSDGNVLGGTATTTSSVTYVYSTLTVTLWNMSGISLVLTADLCVTYCADSSVLESLLNVKLAMSFENVTPSSMIITKNSMGSADLLISLDSSSSSLTEIVEAMIESGFLWVHCSLKTGSIPAYLSGSGWNWTLDSISTAGTVVVEAYLAFSDTKLSASYVVGELGVWTTICSDIGREIDLSPMIPEIFSGRSPGNLTLLYQNWLNLLYPSLNEESCRIGILEKIYRISLLHSPLEVETGGIKYLMSSLSFLKEIDYNQLSNVLESVSSTSEPNDVFRELAINWPLMTSKLGTYEAVEIFLRCLGVKLEIIGLWTDRSSNLYVDYEDSDKLTNMEYVSEMNSDTEYAKSSHLSMIWYSDTLSISEMQTISTSVKSVIQDMLPITKVLASINFSNTYSPDSSADEPLMKLSYIGDIREESSELETVTISDSSIYLGGWYNEAYSLDQEYGDLVVSLWPDSVVSSVIPDSLDSTEYPISDNIINYISMMERMISRYGSFTLKLHCYFYVGSYLSNASYSLDVLKIKCRRNTAHLKVDFSDAGAQNIFKISTSTIYTLQFSRAIDGYVESTTS